MLERLFVAFSFGIHTAQFKCKNVFYKHLEVYPLAEYFVGIDFISEMHDMFLTFSLSVVVRNELDVFFALCRSE